MKKKNAYLFVNGSMGSYSGLQKEITADDYIVAVDGGYRHIEKLNIKPDVIIGDMDSIQYDGLKNLRLQNIEIIQYPSEKDETDLELALDHVIVRDFDRIIVVAALGGRLDHTLTNLFLLTDPKLKDRRVMLFDGVENVFLIESNTKLECNIGDRISLVPILGKVEGVVTKGLKYPLNNETLFTEKGRGISNEVVSKNVEIKITSGQLLCIHTLREKRDLYKE